METNLKLFYHIFIDNKSSQTLFLLHGTGGSTGDFLFLNELLEKKYNIVALKGNVDENGMTRFFKRHALGVFDQENIKQEAEKLHKFITTWMEEHKITSEKLFFLGYSNGANMLLATLFYYPNILKHLVLLHPMLPFKIKDHSLDLSNHKIFVSMGQYDEMVPKSQREELVETLKSSGAKLTIKEYPGGHEIGEEEINDVVEFLI